MIHVNVNGIGKNFGEVQALKNVSFDVQKGELFGLIGPDGAGKTTLFRILTSLMLPNEGSATVNGHDVVKDLSKIRKESGYMPGKFSLYQDLTVGENLNFFASVFNTTVAENYDLIKDIFVMLEPFRKRPAGKLSGGMKQKLALSCALIHRPVVLFLDEPTTGVDPVSRKEFWEMLKKLKTRGITILVSTPYMDEASLCDKVALIQNGEILDINTPDGIVAQYPYDLYEVKGSGNYKLIQNLERFAKTKHVFAFGNGVHLSLSESASTEEIDQYLKSSGLENNNIRQTQPTIEDSFMQLMLAHDK